MVLIPRKVKKVKVLIPRKVKVKVKVSSPRNVKVLIPRKVKVLHYNVVTYFRHEKGPVDKDPANAMNYPADVLDYYT